jgi:hypothetical protein
MTVDTHPNNYWRCAGCCMVQWFESKIITLRGDDIQRACAAARMATTEPLKVHTEMRKVHKEFTDRGGQIHVLAVPRDLPTITLLTATNCTVTYPAHLPTDCLRGTARARDRALARAHVLANPWEADNVERGGLD